jgi:hypothetical protein
MSTLTRNAPAVKSNRKKPTRTLRYDPLASVLSMSIGKQAFAYWLEVLPTDFEDTLAVRLTKAPSCRKPDEPDAYDVAIGPDTASCECKGHLRHGHCKHLDSVRVLRDTGRLT